MNNFSAQLLRLKQALGVTEDQDVASALGMTKAAFSDRKRRGAFPAEKLRAVVASHADWQVDVDYVLTGDSARMREQQRRLDAVRHGRDAAMQVAGATSKQQADMLDAVAQAEIRSLSDAEQLLLGHYRRANEVGQAVILAGAAAAAAASPRAQSPPEKPSKAPKVQQNFHHQVGQVAGGNIINKAAKKR